MSRLMSCRDDFGGFCTARMAEMERAGWVVVGLPDDEHAPWNYTEFGVLCVCVSALVGEVCLEAPRRWELTDAGRAVLDLPAPTVHEGGTE